MAETPVNLSFEKTPTHVKGHKSAHPVPKEVPNYNDIPGEPDDVSDSESESDDNSFPTLSCALTLDDVQETQVSSGTARNIIQPAFQNLQNQAHELDIPRELVLAAEIKESYFETRIRHVEFATWGRGGSSRPACLIVLEVNFQPRAGGSKDVRFSSATVEVGFEDAPTFTPDHAVVFRSSFVDGLYTGPTIFEFAPTLVKGTPTTAEQTTSFGLSMSGNSGGPLVSAGLNLPMPPLIPSVSFNNTTTAPKTGAMVIHGVLRSHPPRRVVWTISENEISKDGIPRRCKLAIIVGYQEGRRFSMKVGMKAKLVGWRGLWPVKAVQGGYKDAPVYFNPGKMMEKGIGVGEHAEKSRAKVLDLGPAEQANEPELLAEMQHLMGGSVSIRKPVHAEDIGPPEAGKHEEESGGKYQWRTWVPKGCDPTSSSVTLVVEENAHVRDLREIDVGGLIRKTPKVDS